MNNFCEFGGPKNAIGIYQNGGWAEYVRAHVSQVTKVPEYLSLDQGFSLLYPYLNMYTASDE